MTLNVLFLFQQQQGSTNSPVFQFWVYFLSTSKFSSSSSLCCRPVLVLRLLRQEIIKQAHVKNTLSTKLVNLEYHCLSLYPVLPCKATNMHCLFLDHCRSLLCSCSSYQKAAIPHYDLQISSALVSSVKIISYHFNQHEGCQIKGTQCPGNFVQIRSQTRI